MMKRDSRENARSLYQVAAMQGGYFTAAQALEVGYAYSQQHFHVAHGNWLRVDHGLYRLRDFPASEREDLIRWSLWSRNRQGAPQAVVSHETALVVHELSDVMPARIHLTVPPSFQKQVPPGCVVHRDELNPGDIEVRDGYLVTVPVRTLLDVADSPLSQEHLNDAVRDALTRGLVSGRMLEAAPSSPAARSRVQRALVAAEQHEPAT